MTRIRFLGAKSSDDAERGGLGAFGDGRCWDEQNCFGASGHRRAMATTGASNFAGAGGAPESTCVQQLLDFALRDLATALRLKWWE